MWFLFVISTWLFLFLCFLWSWVPWLHCCYNLGCLNVGVLWCKLTATLVSIHWMRIITFCLPINIVHRRCLKSLRGQHCQQLRSTALELLDKAIYCHNLAIHIIIRGADCHSNWHCSICPIFALQSLPLNLNTNQAGCLGPFSPKQGKDAFSESHVEFCFLELCLVPISLSFNFTAGNRCCSMLKLFNNSLIKELFTLMRPQHRKTKEKEGPPSW